MKWKFGKIYIFCYSVSAFGQESSVIGHCKIETAVWLKQTVYLFIRGGYDRPRRALLDPIEKLGKIEFGM